MSKSENKSILDHSTWNLYVTCVSNKDGTFSDSLIGTCI